MAWDNIKWCSHTTEHFHDAVSTELASMLASLYAPQYTEKEVNMVDVGDSNQG